MATKISESFGLDKLGFDKETLRTKMVEPLENKRDKIKDVLSTKVNVRNAWTQVKDRLTDVHSFSTNIGDVFNVKEANTSNNNISAKVTNNRIQKQTIGVNVTQLATNAIFVSQELQASYILNAVDAARDWSVASSDVNGGNPLTVTCVENDDIPTITNKLNQVLKQYNAIAEFVLTDTAGTKGNFVFKTIDTGAKQFNALHPSPGDISLPAFFTEKLYGNVPGQNAIVEIDGATVTSKTNVIKNAVAGIEIKAREVGVSQITVDQSPDQLKIALQGIVDSVNASFATIAKYSTAKDDNSSEEAKFDLLAQDYDMQNIVRNLTAILTKRSGLAGNEITTLEDLGLKLKNIPAIEASDNQEARPAMKQLVLDNERKFQEVMAGDLENVKSFLLDKPSITKTAGAAKLDLISLPYDIKYPNQDITISVTRNGGMITAATATVRGTVYNATVTGNDISFDEPLKGLKFTATGLDDTSTFTFKIASGLISDLERKLSFYGADGITDGILEKKIKATSQEVTRQNEELQKATNEVNKKEQELEMMMQKLQMDEQRMRGILGMLDSLLKDE